MWQRYVLRTGMFAGCLVWAVMLWGFSPDDLARARQERADRLLRLEQLPEQEWLDLGAWEAFTNKVPVEDAPEQLGKPQRLLAARYWILHNDFFRAKKMLQGLPTRDPEVSLLLARLDIEAWRLDEAEARLRALENRLPEARFWLGRLMLLRKQYSTAIPYARELRSRDHRPALGYLLEAEAQLWLRNLAAAEEALTRCLELNPFSADARFWYGYVIWRKVDATLLPDMAAQWEFALTLNPLHYLTHWHWGNGHTHLTFADYQDEQEFEIREKLQPAEAAYSAGALARSFALLDSVEAAYPESVLPDLYRGSFWYTAFSLPEHLDAAQAAFQRILARRAHFGPAHNGLAAVIKARRFAYLDRYAPLMEGLQPLPDERGRQDFLAIFPDMKFYPGDRVQRMIWQQLHAGKAYFPLLAKMGKRFVIPPLHKDLALAMDNTWFRRGVTFDNRQWMDIRGVGSGATGIEYVMRGAFLERNVTLHEYVHLFHGTCFTDEEKRRVRALYARAMKEDRTLDYYAANNEHEYLAQTYTAYFAPVKVHPLNHKSVNTRSDLESKDPELFAWIRALVEKQEAFMRGNDSVFRENWAQVYLSLAENSLKTGNFEQALALTDTAMGWGPDYVPAYALRTRILREQDRTGEATLFLRAAARRLGTHPALLREAAHLVRKGEVIPSLGNLQAGAGEDARIRWLKQAFDRESDYSENAILHLDLLEALHDDLRWDDYLSRAETYADSLDAFSTYMRDRQRESRVQAWRLRAARGDTSGLAPLRAALQQRPQDESLRQACADALAYAGQYDQAIAIQKEGLALQEATGGKTRAMIRDIALFSALAGDTDAAHKLFARIASGRDPGLRYGYLMGLLGKEERARGVWERLPEDTRLARAQKAWLHWKLTERSGSKAEQKAAREAWEAFGLEVADFWL